MPTAQLVRRFSFASVGPGEPPTSPPPPSGPAAIPGQQEQQTGEGAQTSADDLRKEIEALRNAVQTERGRARANADAAKRLAEIEDRTKSDTERLTGKVGKLETDLGTARGEIARLTAALKHGLAFDDLVLVPSGLSEEDTEAAAQRLAKMRAPQQTPPPFDGGARGGRAGGDDFNSDIRDALRRTRR